MKNEQKGNKKAGGFSAGKNVLYFFENWNDAQSNKPL